MKKDLFVAVLVQGGMLGKTIISEDIVDVFAETLAWHKKNNNGMVIIEKGIQGSLSTNERFFSFNVNENMVELQQRIYGCVSNYLLKVKREKGQKATL